MLTPENRVKNKVRDYLKSIGAYCFSPVQMGYGSRTLDLLTAIPVIVHSEVGELRTAIFLAIEVKRKGGKLTPFQNKIIRDIQDLGAHAIWGDDAAVIIRQIESLRAHFNGRLVLRLPK
ncbi:MAG TPA: hypothetical protein VLJ17_24760 [Xanthobacteraceae bacterium]|nr:hypothetical protein [Xanthobacteraceae bacterium]